MRSAVSLRCMRERREAQTPKGRRVPPRAHSQAARAATPLLFVWGTCSSYGCCRGPIVVPVVVLLVLLADARGDIDGWRSTSPCFDALVLLLLLCFRCSFCCCHWSSRPRCHAAGRSRRRRTRSENEKRAFPPKEGSPFRHRVPFSSFGESHRHSSSPLKMNSCWDCHASQSNSGVQQMLEMIRS